MLDELVKRIACSSNIDESAVRGRILEKQAELSGLISEEGAAYIIAKELGVSLLRKQERLHIANVAAGMQNADIVGKIIRMFPVREFHTDKGSGRVENVVIADSTGSVRLSLWNEEIDALEIKEGDVVHVRGYIRQDNMGEPELRLGRYGSMQKSDENIDVKVERQVERAAIADLKEGHYREVRAAVLQVFESTPVYAVCAECGASIKEKCELHPAAAKDYELVISGIVDDGTESMRVVMFKENAEKVLGMKKDDVKAALEQNGTKRVFEGVELGKEYVFEGRVRTNQLFQRTEFIANNVRDVDVKEEIRLMVSL